ncbi:ferrous iron transport protein B [Peribacillus sp. B-H-3]|uniref:ferrous iron transport protein B n=1 Tax=Peribacillus sp. B-H-3 TaxID=3400420 RepID=UPI003B02B374
MSIALLGNPNTGKTSLFNHLTGSYEYVGNWSGVTVEKKVGTLKHSSGKIIDLPGVYTLNPLSRDEGVVTQFFLNETCRTVLNILDASQLERNLHLTMQIMEYGKPIVIGLNMGDVADKRGIKINAGKLSSILGSPVVPITARNGSGCDELAEVVVQENVQVPLSSFIDYGQAVEEGIVLLGKQLPETRLSVRWLCLQLLEGNPDVKHYLEQYADHQWLEEFISVINQKVIAAGNSKSAESYIYETRQKKIKEIIHEVMERKETKTLTLTDRVDAIVTNKYLGIPIFCGVMYLMFMLTFDWFGFPLSNALDAFMSGPLTKTITLILNAAGASGFIKSLILDGIVAGVGGVLVFVPQIFILFLFISILEDSGYMARVALVMDRLMESVGLNGKAFIPMIIGFGCNVPGIMSARTIEQPKERLLTILLTPLMSCSARLPVYTLFAGAFFVHNKALIVLSLYLLGIAVALVLAKIFSSTILKGESSFFVIELPPYRMPQGKALWRSTWDKGKGFVKKAGTFIFAGSVFIWLLSNSGLSGWGVNMDDSFLAMIGGTVAPLLAPLGFGTWQAGASLITGFLAKEAIISSMNIIYHTSGDVRLQGLLGDFFTPLSAYSFMAFILLYIPCLATTATIFKETNSKKWTFFAVVYALILAYIISIAIYQGGKLFF